MDKIDAITVRMYNTGSVGDCLLLLFQKKEKITFTMLIDCGGFMTDNQIITSCVANIKETVKNKIDLVVVTHEHLDHVSGFNQALNEFNHIEFSQVWMAWTEDDTDPLARKLKKDLGKKLKALISTLTKEHTNVDSKVKKTNYQKSLNERFNYYSKSFGNILDALHFEAGNDKSLKSSLTVSSAMTFVKNKSKDKVKEKMYKKPGDVIRDLKGAEGIKFHILGPPYDDDLSGIKNKMQKDELYSLNRHLAFNGKQAFLNAVTASETDAHFSKSPFHRKYYMDISDKRKFSEMYNADEMSWRQIEEDWLGVSEELAIAVNTYTNNTSLAMAIEFEDTGKVLLFPADAQSGNWISWHNEKVTSSLKKNGGKTADELLANTVFYKVGHHGSHNGTASKSGLDKMTNHNLVAMMPLVQNKVPLQWGGSKNFPAKMLYNELIKRTNGAVIRTDEGVIKDIHANELREKNLSVEMLEKLKKVSKGLYQEWTINI